VGVRVGVAHCWKYLTGIKSVSDPIK